MTPWQAGDQVGMGLVYLPDKKTRDAYGKACRDQWIESAAQQVVQLRMREDRRNFINSFPAFARDQLKKRVTELWHILLRQKKN